MLVIRCRQPYELPRNFCQPKISIVLPVNHMTYGTTGNEHDFNRYNP